MAERVDYHRYMASREWALKKRAVRERSGGDCERCEHRKMAQVHHLSYQHLGNEPLEDLLGVCKWCHEYESAKRDVDPVDTFDYEFYKGFAYECDADENWVPIDPESIHTPGNGPQDKGNCYVNHFGTWWQEKMEEKYGPDWATILNRDLELIGCVMLDGEDARVFAALPVVLYEQ